MVARGINRDSFYVRSRHRPILMEFNNYSELLGEFHFGNGAFFVNI